MNDNIVPLQERGGMGNNYWRVPVGSPQSPIFNSSQSLLYFNILTQKWSGLKTRSWHHRSVKLWPFIVLTTYTAWLCTFVTVTPRPRTSTLLWAKRELESPCLCVVWASLSSWPCSHTGCVCASHCAPHMIPSRTHTVQRWGDWDRPPTFDDYWGCLTFAIVPLPQNMQLGLHQQEL